MSDGGKGSKPRPFSIAHEEYSKRWDAIFQRDLKEEEADNRTFDQRMWDKSLENMKENEKLGD